MVVCLEFIGYKLYGTLDFVQVDRLFKLPYSHQGIGYHLIFQLVILNVGLIILQITLMVCDVCPVSLARHLLWCILQFALSFVICSILQKLLLIRRRWEIYRDVAFE